jgi:hypothetical protein
MICSESKWSSSIFINFCHGAELRRKNILSMPIVRILNDTATTIFSRSSFQVVYIS